MTGAAREFTLEIYIETEGDRHVAEQWEAALLALVRELAPHVTLHSEIIVQHKIERYPGGDWPCHSASAPGRQTMLVTNEALPQGAQGWGGNQPARCVVSKPAVLRKATNRGDPADVLIHEWLHTIYGETIRGWTVPFVDDAVTMGFSPVVGPDGEDTWHDWYRFALGG